MLICCIVSYRIASRTAWPRAVFNRRESRDNKHGRRRGIRRRDYSNTLNAIRRGVWCDAPFAMLIRDAKSTSGACAGVRPSSGQRSVRLHGRDASIIVSRLCRIIVVGSETNKGLTIMSRVFRLFTDYDSDPIVLAKWFLLLDATLR